MKRSPAFKSKQFDVRLKITLRLAEETDLLALEWWGWHSKHRDVIRSVYAETLRGEHLMLVADSGGFPVGQAWIDLAQKKDAGVGVIWAIRVIPGFSGAGIGSRLIHAAEQIVRELGYATSEIGVEYENQRAKRLYERMGYQVVGSIRDKRKYRAPDGQQKLLVTDQWILQKSLKREARPSAA